MALGIFPGPPASPTCWEYSEQLCSSGWCRSPTDTWYMGLGLGACSIYAATRLWALIYTHALQNKLPCLCLLFRKNISERINIYIVTQGISVYMQYVKSLLFHTQILSCPCNLTALDSSRLALSHPSPEEKKLKKANRCSSCDIWRPDTHSGFGQILWKGNPACSATWRFLAQLCANSRGRGCVTSA